MNVFEQIITYITKLQEKEFQKQISILLGSITCVVLGIMYYAYSQRTSRITHIQSLHKSGQKVFATLANNDRIEQERTRIEEILNENKDFRIESFFEQFCKEYNVMPEPGWNTTINPIEGNEAFDEIILPATFQGQTTKTLAKLLEALDEKEIIYIKELFVTREKDTITCTLELATKKKRKGL